MITALWRRMRPPSRLAGRLGVQSLLFALGQGTFLTGSAVFFTQIVGLSAAQVGLGLTIGGVAAFLTAWPSGKLVDRFGTKRMWLLGMLTQAGLFLIWPFVTSFSGYVALAVGMEVVGGLGGTAYIAYTIDVLPVKERVTSRAYTYSALNIGFTLGSLMGGIALAFNSDPVLRAVPWFTTLAFLVNALLMSRLPNAPHDDRTPVERRLRIPGRSAFRNPGWLASTFFGGVMQSHQVLLTIVIPLWLVQRTDAPHVLLAFLFGTNTVLCILLPMATARGVRDLSTALRAIRISAVFFVLSCVITLYSHDTIGWVTIALVWIGHVAVTGAELFDSAATWSFEADLMDPRRRGEYQGAARLSGTLGQVWAPALYTFLAMNWGTTGWLMIAGIVVVAAVSLHPSAHLAQRFIHEHVPTEERASEEISAAGEAPPLPA